MKYELIAAHLYDVPLLCTLERAQQIERALHARMTDRGDTGMWPLEVRAALELPKPEDRLSMLAGDAYERRAGYVLNLTNGVAVVPVHGTLVQRGGGMDAMSGFLGYNMLAARLDAANADPDVRGVVLDVDSPGGEVAGAFEMAAAVRGSPKPVWAVANELAASAAYLIGSAASRLYAPKLGIVGSIGVVMLHADRSRQHDKAGVTYTPIVAGKRKIEGSSLGPLSADARKAAQARVDAVYADFKATVADQRAMTEEAVGDTEAAIIQAPDAQTLGFVDGIATLSQTIAMLAESLEGDPSTEQPRRGGTSAHNERTTNMDPKDTKPPATGPGAGAAASDTKPTVDALTAERKAGMDAERARVQGILGHAEAQGAGRAELAQHFAFKTEASVEHAVAALSALPKPAAAAEPVKAETTDTPPANLLAAAMGKLENPDVGATGGDADASESEKAAALVLSFTPAHRLRKSS